MNLKRTLLSLAVASVAAAPIMASAADGSVYANVRYGFTQADDGQPENVNKLKDMGSRWGMKGDTDLGNGMTAFGHYEQRMTHQTAVDQDKQTVGDNVRSLKVGVKGDFGQVYMGDDINHTWDTMMTTDDSWWYGGAMHITEGLQNNTITYMGGSGPVSFGISAAMTKQGANVNEESVDAMEIGVSFDAGVAQIAVAMSDAKTATADPEAVMGVVVKTTAGPLGVALDYQTQDGIGTDSDLTSMQLQVSMDNFLFQYGENENGKVDLTTQSNMVLSYYTSLGPNTLIWYEYGNVDFDSSKDDSSNISATLKYNIM